MIGTVTDPWKVVVFLGNNFLHSVFVGTTEPQLVETPAWSGAAFHGSVTGTVETRLDVRASVRSGRGKGSTVPRRRASRQAPKPKTQLRVIPGALSLYRVGDVITFYLNGIEFEAAIDCVETRPGDAVLWVTTAIGVHPGHVKRVERRAL